MDISLFTAENSYANAMSAVSKILFITFQHKSNNIIDIQA